jgi:MFS-type transporter involved in bile tolerance (Atg22 family)
VDRSQQAAAVVVVFWLVIVVGLAGLFRVRRQRRDDLHE